MKKLALLSVLVFAASTTFAQTAMPGKSTPKVSNQPVLTKPVNTADVKGAGKNNPVGKSGVNTSKPAVADKVNSTKVGTSSTPVKKN